MSRVDRRTVAIHEAGHAVTATRAGWPLRYVTLAPRAHGGRGQVRPYSYAVGTDTWDEMVVFAAGPIAHDIITGCRNRMPIIASLSDFEHIRDAARYTHHAVRAGEPLVKGLPRTTTVRQYVVASWADACRQVMDDWGAVLAVADALLDSRRAVSGKAIRRIVAAAAPVEPPPHAHLAASFWASGFTPPGWWAPARRDSEPAAVLTVGGAR